VKITHKNKTKMNGKFFEQSFFLYLKKKIFIRIKNGRKSEGGIKIRKGS
jgi:hypothetical protein